MDITLEMGKSSAKGSFHLLIGVAGSTVIMALGTLVLASLLPTNEVGLYGMALIPSTMINYFRDWGINSALTRRIANLRGTGQESEIPNVIRAGVIFEVLTGIILSLICFAVAEPLAYILSPMNASNLTVYISIMSISIFAGALAAAASGIFVGFERMKLNSFYQILQAIVKTALGPLLIVIGFGVLGAVYAATFSVVASGIVAIMVVYFVLFRKIGKSNVSKLNIKQTLKPMLNFGLPLTVSTIVAGVVPQVFIFTMAVYAGASMMGNYYVCTYFVALLTFISFPVSTTLFPVFSKLNPQKEPELVKTIFSSSVKYTAMLLVPAALLLITLSNPIINTLFPRAGILHSLLLVNAAPKYPYAPLFLSLSCLASLLVLGGNVVLSTFQTGIGKTRQIMKQSIVTLIVGLPLAFLLVDYFNSIGGPEYAIIGGILGSLIATVPNIAWGLHWSWKNYKVKADFGVSAKILTSSTLAMAITYMFIKIVNLPSFLELASGFFIFMVAYLITAPLIGAINKADIENLKSMSSGLGIFSRLLDLPLKIMIVCISKRKATQTFGIHPLEKKLTSL